MFEKDAEEYIEKHTFFDEEYGVQSLDVISKTIFKDGAVFGYNKCFEQIRKLVNEATRLDCIIPELLRLKESE